MIPLHAPHMGLSGVVRDVVIRRRSGLIRKRLGPVRNLILDQGLDQVAAHRTATLSQHCAIGTNDTPALVSQTGLGDEKARTSNIITTGGASGTVQLLSGEIQQPAGPLVFVHRRTFLFTAGLLDSGVDGAYTELGFSPSASAGDNLFSRLLLPEPLEVGDDETAEIVYELSVGLAPSSLTPASFDVAGIGEIGYEHIMQGTWSADASNTAGNFCLSLSTVGANGAISSSPNNFCQCFEPMQSLVPIRVTGSLGTIAAAGQNNNWTSTGSLVWFGVFGEADTFAAARSARSAYAAGNYYRDVTCVAQPEEANFEWHAITIGTLSRALSGGAAAPRGIVWLARIDDADRFTKADTHKLTFTVRQSWGRAA